MKPAMRFPLALCLALAALVWGAAADAAQPAQKTFVITPFAVHAPQSYTYLSKAVPGTIQSKLNRPGILEGRTLQGKAASAAEARKAMTAAGADYAIWGAVNVMGNDCSLEVNCVDKAGKTWSRTAEAPVSGLTGAVQNLSSALGSEVMGVTVAAKPAFMTRQPGQTAPSGARAGGEIIVNETGQQQTYLNPQFRYQGAGAADGSRLRSQRIKENMVDMAVADFNGDGKNEIAVLGDHNLTIYVWEAGGRLKQLGATVISASNLNFSMRAMDLDRDGAAELVVATFEEDGNRPYSYFFSFKGNKLAQCAERIPYFASVMRMPPGFSPVLVGQGYDSVKLFAPGVHQLVKSGNKYTLGARFNLPSGATVFNVAWIPAGKEGSDLIAMLTDDERVKLFQANGTSPIHTTMERFSGSATGMDFYKTMPGLGIDRTGQLPGKIYAPMRMITTDLGRTGEQVLILNKPISTASQFFDRYRFFPQGEIHALYWDGVGLGLKWKTRRIRGSVAEIDLADVTNDGVLDLVVGVNTSPELGIGSRQSMILAYPLDVSQMDPNVPADMSDFEVNPNR